MDEIDKKIIAQLQADGRTSLEELAKITGFTSMGIKKRLDRLIEKGIIKISALINPGALGFHPAVVMLEMESAEAMQNVLDRFADCPRVIQIFKTMGGYNLIALVIAEDSETLKSISMEKCSLRSSPGIRRSEFYPINETLFSPFLQVRESLALREKNSPPCKVDCDPCVRFKLQKCVGCPTTSKYKGAL